MPLNYYRISIVGNSSGGSTRYVSGFFDSEAVEKYFNEFKQPKDGIFIDYSLPEKRPALSVRGLSEKDVTDASLVLLLSTNTDAVAQGISTLAQNEEVTRSLTLLAAKDRIKQNGEAANELEVLNGRAEYFQRKGDAVIGGLKDDASKETVQSSFLDFANSLATLLGHTGTFENLDEAWAWLKAKG